MILDFQNVQAAATPGLDSGLVDLRFKLQAGDLLLLRVDARARRTALPDLAQGLLAPDRGAVAFLGEDWVGMAPDHAAAQRGRIGRIFETGGWLNNLDVIENITLAQRYHTARTEPELLDAAHTLSLDFGLEDLPEGRPHAVARPILRRAQWVRALLGQPKLLVFESPAQDIEARWLDRLIARTHAACAAGAAAIWITSNPEEWNNRAMNPSLKFELKDARLHPAV